MRLNPAPAPLLRSLALILATGLATGLTGPGGPTPALAQAADFRPVLYVNGSAVTGYELDQRMRFLQVLGAEGDLMDQARQALIDDRLRIEAGKTFGVSVTEDQVLAGIAEFAGRANLDVEQFLAAVEPAGVAPETVRDFVRAGLVWRELVQARFGPQALIPDAAADRALTLEANRGLPPRVLISELVVAAEPGESPEALLERVTALRARIGGEGAFAAAAERLSVASTAAEGGRIDWRPVIDLPAPARAAIAGLQPGQVSQPVPVGNGAALFLLRGVREGAQVAPEGPSVEYAELSLGAAGAAAEAEAARVVDRAEACGDLFAAATPDDGRLRFATLPEAGLPADLRGVIAGLDAGETAVLTRGGGAVLVMLCARRAGGPGDVPSVESMRAILLNERLSAQSDLWLAELRDAAVIRDR